jgi:hypothetical protein
MMRGFWRGGVSSLKTARLRLLTWASAFRLTRPLPVAQINPFGRGESTHAANSTAAQIGSAHALVITRRTHDCRPAQLRPSPWPTRSW